MAERKIAYISMVIDEVHLEHIDIIQTAQYYGNVIIGLVTDEALVRAGIDCSKPYADRKRILESFKGVLRVVPQETIDFIPNLRMYRPAYLIQDDMWTTSLTDENRDEVIQILAEWGGQLIHPSERYMLSSEMLDEDSSAVYRRSRLKHLLQTQSLVRTLEAHSGLSASIIENTQIEVDDLLLEYDAIWLSSLTNSLIRGKPDTECLDVTSKLGTICNILEVTQKPIIYDGDTGGDPDHFTDMIQVLETLGISAVIIEDKDQPKRNSLYGTTLCQVQTNCNRFVEKIARGTQSRSADDFLIFARIESLVLDKGCEDALMRARAYIDAGADGIMIHSRKEKADEILEFCKAYRAMGLRSPLIAAPTTYCTITEQELESMGVHIVIYANHLLRSAYPSMKTVAESILRYGRGYEASKNNCMSYKEVLDLESVMLQEKIPETSQQRLQVSPNP